MACPKGVERENPTQLRAVWAAWLVGSLACACATEPAAPDCTEDRCDTIDSRDDLITALEGHGDPIAQFLRENSTDAGTIAGDYNDVLGGLGELVGCDASTERSFVVLSNTDFIPKTVFARCASTPQAASQFFVAAPALTADADMDPRNLHMTAWDEDAKRYRHYATVASGDEMALNVEPTFCLGCHGGPERLESWQPLMNEMTNPWSGWNAEPGFASQLFDEFLDGDVAGGVVYNEMLSSARLDSASNLEPLIRAGISRVASARILERNDAASVETALELLRPLFCDETVNYVSEVHDSGEIRLDAVIDEGLRDIVSDLEPEAPWAWRGEANVILPAPSGDDPPISLIATRATASVEIERALVSRQVLSRLDVLRARAIDWTRPVGSEARCEVYRAGADRIAAGAIDSDVANLPADATSADLIPLAYAELLRNHPSTATAVTAIADSVAGSSSALVTARELGDAVDASIAALQAPDARSSLRAERDKRGCWAESLYLSAPIIPDLDCP